MLCIIKTGFTQGETMNLLEKKIAEILEELKENHQAIGLKAEFEAEGCSLEEALSLKNFAQNAGLELSIKIGGCEAIKDLHEIKTIGAKNIIAPMIETPYAMEKFIKATQKAFSENERKDFNFYINIETITGFNNFNDIASSEFFKEIKGIVLGRFDMAGSLGLTREHVNSEAILNIAKILSEKSLSFNKEFIVGGGVYTDSIDFFKKLPYLNKFETRKIIFDAQKALSMSNIKKAILKAIEFEILWLKNKRDSYGIFFQNDEIRVQLLENIYSNLLKNSESLKI